MDIFIFLTNFLITNYLFEFFSQNNEHFMLHLYWLEMFANFFTIIETIY